MSNEIQKKLDILNTCMCCDDHNTRKPTVFKQYRVKSCECRCRQEARDLCRGYRILTKDDKSAGSAGIADC